MSVLARCPSYRESTKMGKEGHDHSVLGVWFRKVSLVSVKKELTVYYQYNCLFYTGIQILGVGQRKGRAATGLEFERGATFLYRIRYGKLCTYRALLRDNYVLLQQGFLAFLYPQNLLHRLQPL